MTVRLGVTLPQFSDDARRAVQAAQSAEAVGLDSVWLFDHLWPLTGGRDRMMLEGWSTLAAVAAATERITIGTLVTRSTLRHPALLAKMAATVAAIAPGRLIVGLGSGDHKSRSENEAFGIPYHSGVDRTDQLRSTAEVCRSFWDAAAFSHTDDFVTVEKLPASPKPPGAPKLWIGGRGDAALAIAADIGDAWNGWSGSAKHLAEDAARVRTAAGERPVGITWGGQVSFGAGDPASLAQRHKDPYLVSGPPEALVQSLSDYVAAGAEHIILTQVGHWSEEVQEALGTEVGPALKSL